MSLEWLVLHAALTVGKYRIGRCAKTPHELLRGRPFDREVVEFGECVDYLGLGSKGKDKQDSRWKHGVWLGIKEDSGEVIIGTEKGITKARDVHRRGDPKERWNWEVFEKVVGTPWEPVPNSKGINIPSELPTGDEQQPIIPGVQGHEKSIIRRRVQIKRRDVETYGTTEGCSGCIALMSGCYRPHLDECYARFEGIFT